MRMIIEDFAQAVYAAIEPDVRLVDEAGASSRRSFTTTTSARGGTSSSCRTPRESRPTPFRRSCAERRGRGLGPGGRLDRARHGRSRRGRASACSAVPEPTRRRCCALTRRPVPFDADRSRRSADRTGHAGARAGRWRASRALRVTVGSHEGEPRVIEATVRAMPDPIELEDEWEFETLAQRAAADALGVRDDLLRSRTPT
jgi:hypothetical protein